MELGKNLARIVDYGTTKTKGGAAQVFIKFSVSGEESTWYGVPFKKDSDEVNDICMTQLCYCGFDPSVNKIEDLSFGIDSGLLATGEDIDVYVADQILPDGSQKRRINTIGEIGPARATATEVQQLISETKQQKLREAASKFKVRKKKDPNKVIPF